MRGGEGGEEECEGGEEECEGGGEEGRSAEGGGVEW